MGYLQEERETIISTDDTMDNWHVYTRQQKIMTKLRKIGAEPVKVIKEGDTVVEAEYIVGIKQISFRKLKILTEEEKLIRSERAKANFGHK